MGREATPSANAGRGKERAELVRCRADRVRPARFRAPAIRSGRPWAPASAAPRPGPPPRRSGAEGSRGRPRRAGAGGHSDRGTGWRRAGGIRATRYPARRRAERGAGARAAERRAGAAPESRGTWRIMHACRLGSCRINHAAARGANRRESADLERSQRPVPPNAEPDRPGRAPAGNGDLGPELLSGRTDGRIGNVLGDEERHRIVQRRPPGPWPSNPAGREAAASSARTPCKRSPAVAASPDDTRPARTRSEPPASGTSSRSRT